ncbi:jmjC domain, hydroxylase domain-containing protein [Ditylenchus destructor]|nr:jmjC domain, hydroxylase domain-containing protein [Ditylenchus destructor]
MLCVLSDSPAINITFFLDYALSNEACLLSKEFTSSWQAVQKWTNEDGSPNLDHLLLHFGDANVPVLLDDDQCSYETMKFHEFVEKHLGVGHRKDVAYLKDWHFQSEFPDVNAYVLPAFLSFDWINNETWTTDKNNPTQGDYRFVYFGCKGSWTRFHSDVMGSFSWSANICGRKQWYLLRPGNESHFAQGKGNFIDDIRTMKDKWPEAGVIEFIQEPGEITFIPSGWYHQVHNLEDSISINHNVINACNIDILLKLVQSRMTDVQAELLDVRDILSSQEFLDQCQALLLADLRINVPKLTELLELVIGNRGNSNWTCDVHGSNVFECKRSPECMVQLRAYMERSCSCSGGYKICKSCSDFMKKYERACAISARNRLINA